MNKRGERNTWILDESDLDAPARRLVASLTAAGQEADLASIRRALWVWAMNVTERLLLDADNYILEPELLDIPAARDIEPGKFFRALRRNFLAAADLTPAQLALTRRQGIEWRTIREGWNLTASSIIARRGGVTHNWWALFSGMRNGEQITDWLTAPDAHHVPKLVKTSEGTWHWFWVWNQEEI